MHLIFIREPEGMNIMVCVGTTCDLSRLGMPIGTESKQVLVGSLTWINIDRLKSTLISDQLIEKVSVSLINSYHSCLSNCSHAVIFYSITTDSFPK